MSTPRSSSKQITPSSDKNTQSKDAAGAMSKDTHDSKLLDNESPRSQGTKPSIFSKDHQDGQATSAKVSVPSPISPLRYIPLFTTKDEHIVASILHQSDFNSQSNI